MTGLIKMTMGLLLLALLMILAGCSAFRCDAGYDCYGDVVLVPVEEPEPPIIICPGPPLPPPPLEPVYVHYSSPPPTRHQPLTKPRGNGETRIKTPRGDRGGRGADKPIIASRKDKPAEPAVEADNRRPRRKTNQRR